MLNEVWVRIRVSDFTFNLFLFNLIQTFLQYYKGIGQSRKT